MKGPADGDGLRIAAWPGYRDHRCRRQRRLQQYVDAKTAAARLNLPVNDIYRLIESGKLPVLLFPVRI